MKNTVKCIVLILLTFLFSACGKGATENMIEVKDEQLPVKVMYHQMWETYTYAESTDPELIRTLLNELKDVKIGNETKMGYDDFGDSIVFEYSDGTQTKYYFEDNIYVMEDGSRYEVEGLDPVRDTLRTLIPD